LLVHLEITDRAGPRTVSVERESFWIGTLRSSCEVELDLAAAFGRVLEVRAAAAGRLQVRTEPGLPFPVRGSAGNLGTRFTSILDGEVLSVGPALVKLRCAGEAVPTPEELDPARLEQAPGPGAPVDSWYQTFMELADHLEGLSSAEKMIQAAMDAILAATSAERVCLELALDPGETKLFFLAQGGDKTPFRVSRSLIEQVRDSGRVVHVPIAKDDPIVRDLPERAREGISSSIALPIKALGNSLGVLYADCVREGAMLTATDLQRVAFVSRMLAPALGNRELVAPLVKSDPSPDGRAPGAAERSARRARRWCSA
jgi:hypothetical protein